MTNKKVKLPKNTQQINKKGYTEVIVPPSKRPKSRKTKLIKKGIMIQLAIIR